MLTRLGFLSFPKTIILSIGVSVIVPVPLQAQVLEEIVVTAQRREQSLQDVPISLETYSGNELLQEGFRELEQLGQFTPSVYIEGGDLETTIRLRGIGTSGRALTLAESVATFVDGIHYPRSSQVKTAFLDVDRIEILKGPQPVYFGANATAGAFNIQSKKPTPEWEGYATGEWGNFDERAINVAAGGPITDTLGIRLAGSIDNSGGFLSDIVFPNERVGDVETKGARVTLRWTPTDNFQVTTKFDISDMTRDPAASSICDAGGIQVEDPDEENEADSVWLPYPRGAGTTVQHEPISTDCMSSDQGVGFYYYAPEIHVRSNIDSNSGIVDIREVLRILTEEEQGSGNIKDTEILESRTGYVDFLYSLDNGISLNWQTSYSDYLRDYKRKNDGTPYLLRYQNRREDNVQISTELRATSASGGMFEWMAGAYYADSDYDFSMFNSQGDIRRSRRVNGDNWENAEWLTGFGTVTFNFMDNRASIDVGGRWTQVDKEIFVQGFAQSWVFDVTPCAWGPDDFLGGGLSDPADCTDPALQHPDAVRVDASDVRVLLTSVRNRPVDLNNLWTIPFNTDRFTPPTWRGNRTMAVGVTMPDYAGREAGPHNESLTENSFDPQITLRYRPNDNLSFFARYATAFKEGGWDSAVSSIPPADEFAFLAEEGQTFEVGAKGTFWDGRARFDVTVYEHKVSNLQLETPNPDPDSSQSTGNVAAQVARGIDFGVTAAVTDRLTAGLTGMILDADMKEFFSRCSEDELENFEISGCDPVRRIIDRSGQEAPFSQDWKVVLDLDYRMPVFGNYELGLKAKGYISDGYHTNVLSLSESNSWDVHEDVNLTASFGDNAGVWDVSAYARNLLEPRRPYVIEDDLTPDGLRSANASESSFIHYGLKLRYNFF